MQGLSLPKTRTSKAEYRACAVRPESPNRFPLTPGLLDPNVNVSYIHMRPSMTSAANQDAYASPWLESRSVGQRPRPAMATTQQRMGRWGNQWGGPPFWHPAGISRPAAIAFTVLGFIFWWPVGLALLIYMIGSGRMGCFGRQPEGDVSRHEGAVLAASRRRGPTGNPGPTVRPATAGPSLPATTPSTNTRLKPSAAWRRSRRTSAPSSNGCASPRTSRSSTSSWPNAGPVRPLRPTDEQPTA